MTSQHAARSAHRPKPAAECPEALALPALLRSLLDGRGRAVIDRVAEAFGMSKTQLALTLGLSRAEALVKEGKASAVRDYLDFIAQGNFA